MLFFIGLIPAWAIAKKEVPTNVGILSFPGSHTKEQLKPLVRFGFIKRSDWEVIKSKDLPKNVTWNIAFDGKTLGTISTQINESNLYSAQRSLLVSSDINKIKKFDNSKKAYGSWMGYDRFRPMVIVSNKNTSDPERWKPSNSKAAISKAKKSFLEMLKPISICDKETYEVKEKIKVKSSQVSFIKGYENKLDEYIVGLRLPDYWSTTNCDGEAPDEFSTHWLYVKGKKAQLIGNQIVPIDAGDYDNDGRSEWIFQISRYNEDGYGMFPLNTKKMLEFTWSYH